MCEPVARSQNPCPSTGAGGRRGSPMGTRAVRMNASRVRPSATPPRAADGRRATETGRRASWAVRPRPPASRNATSPTPRKTAGVLLRVAATTSAPAPVAAATSTVPQTRGQDSRGSRTRPPAAPVTEPAWRRGPADASSAPRGGHRRISRGPNVPGGEHAFWHRAQGLHRLSIEPVERPLAPAAVRSPASGTDRRVRCRPPRRGFGAVIPAGPARRRRRLPAGGAARTGEVTHHRRHAAGRAIAPRLDRVRLRAVDLDRAPRDAAPPRGRGRATRVDVGAGPGRTPARPESAAGGVVPLVAGYDRLSGRAGPRRPGRA